MALGQLLRIDMAEMLAGVAMASYFISPALTIWGWMRAWREPPRTILAVLSAVGLALATCSAFLAVGTLLYAKWIGGFPYYDPRLMRIYGWGGLLSLLGLMFGLAGLWKRSSTRWLALICSLWTIVYWVAIGSSE